MLLTTQETRSLHIKFIFFLSWISRRIRIVFEFKFCFVFHSFLNCVCFILLFFNFGNIWRNPPPEVFYKKSVLEHFANLTGKYLCRRLFFNRIECIDYPDVYSLIFLYTLLIFYFLIELLRSYNYVLTRT